MESLNLKDFIDESVTENTEGTEKIKNLSDDDLRANLEKYYDISEEIDVNRGGISRACNLSPNNPEYKQAREMHDCGYILEIKMSDEERSEKEKWEKQLKENTERSRERRMGN